MPSINNEVENEHLEAELELLAAPDLHPLVIEAKLGEPVLPRAGSASCQVLENVALGYLGWFYSHTRCINCH